jgi:N-methylhydantoinase B
MTDNKWDPIQFELLRNAVISIADEMALTIVRTTYSGVLRDNMDFSTAFCDPAGNLVAQGLTLPGHLGSIPTALAAVINRFGDVMKPDDLFCLNDPYQGGMHLPDIFIFKPIFHNGERIAFAATICHHTDVGGRVAGSNASDSTEIYQEGLRIPPMYMFEQGKRNETLFNLIEANVRVPVKVFGDIRAQLAACNIAERQFLELVDEHGVNIMSKFLLDFVDYAERVTKAALLELPDGEWSFEDWIDDDGVDIGHPIRLFVKFIKKGDRLFADWTGTSEQVKGAINNTLSFTKAATYCGVKCILPNDVPANEGFFRCVEVTAPPGTIANGVLPAACAARGLTGFRMVDCVLGALAMMLPNKVMAASDGGNTGISIGGYDSDRNPFIYVDFACGTWGARPWADGLSGNSNLFANMATQSIEVCEAENPVEILAYEFVPDKAGAGKFRGGTPYRRDYKLLETEAVLQVRSDRKVFRPYGLYGGNPGASSSNIMNPGKDNRPLGSKLTMTMYSGEVLRHELAGGGGWGDPLERNPEKVLKDVRNELVSINSAREDYGVVIQLDSWSVDYNATQKLRSDIYKLRIGKTPVVLRENWPRKNEKGSNL